MAKASHIAFPATCATTPRMEKMPAPIIPPMPMETAANMPICADLADAALPDWLTGVAIFPRSTDTQSVTQICYPRSPGRARRGMYGLPAGINQGAMQNLPRFPVTGANDGEKND